MKHLFFLSTALFFSFYTYGQNTSSDYTDLVDDGVKLLEQTNVVEAIRKFEQALKVKPEGIEALYGVGVCMGAQCAENDSACYSALDYFLKVEKIAGNYRFTYQNITSSYLKLSQFSPAIEYCNKAIEINANDAESYYYRAYAQANIGKAKEACQDIQKATALGYDDAKQLSEELCK